MKFVAPLAVLALALSAAPANAQAEAVDCTLRWAASPTDQTWNCIRPS